VVSRVRCSDRGSKRVRTLALIAAGTATVLADAAVAVAGYGPVAPFRPPVPGAFSVVIASRTIGPNGGTLSVTIGHTGLRLKVPAHALARPVQFTFTRPRLSDLRTAVPKGKHLVVGFALLADAPSGGQIRGSFSRSPVLIAISNRTLTRRAQVLAWNPAHHQFVRFAAVVRTGQIVVAPRRSAEFLVISPGSNL
jgi:hypothetical protein